MKIVKDILYGVHLLALKGGTAGAVDHLTFNSKDVTASSVFFAIKGTMHDGHTFIGSVIEQGCTNIVVDRELDLPEGVNVFQVENTSNALSIVAHNFFGEPSGQLKLIGVTGTNGKTTIATLLYDLYTNMGYQAGLISTVVNKVCDRDIPATHTTPNPIELNRLLSEMVDEGVSHCFMEVSSHAIHQKRIGGLVFAGGAFTNITHDHLDYHNTFKEYIDVKKAFFDQLPKNAFALTNSDDKNGMVMLQNTKAKQRTYAMKSMADYKVRVLENQFSGLVLTMNGMELWTKLIGDFNAYNLLCVYGITQELGEDSTEALTTISQLGSVDGRFEYVRSTGGITAIIDYAHTPDALDNVLKTIDNIRTKNETVFTVVGCGGDRDKTKRPAMATIACERSDKVILTSDNPRSEDPNVIIEDMMEGVDGTQFMKTLSIVDRGQAIKTAVSMAEENDIILIAGKGHEKYQDIKGVKHDFDDKQTIIELFNKLNK
ncbi:MAG: UDP-N-acetylmuramoyl-L-alanyl-D-glutamate--2,6-diaminopimelate ligase [Crocinitomicaceae bacterium]|nr:UDP-N-acetylmuramoyl-L-alanyl-D-glutamate--2,6-diaminopimelate ligase [Crocinitomicaceae bacterium]MDG1657999.1 UDP-N-acetylmuramoyl-L-alanyl-D-glutamate--2,6-diaminopimelate ligase [Crocinitomicaceae bacterium]